MSETIVATVGARNVPGKFVGRVAGMVAAGIPLDKVADLLQIPLETARESLERAEDAEKPIEQASAKGAEKADYIRLAADVARRRDQCGEKVAAIAEALGVSKAVVSRAYAFALRSGLSKPGEQCRGLRPNVGLGIEKHREIVRRPETGELPATVADEVRCSLTAVYCTLRALKSETSTMSSALPITPGASGSS